MRTPNSPLTRRSSDLGPVSTSSTRSSTCLRTDELTRWYPPPDPPLSRPATRVHAQRPPADMPLVPSGRYRSLVDSSHAQHRLPGRAVSALGLPAVVLPVGIAGGLPQAVQLIGPPVPRGTVPRCR